MKKYLLFVLLVSLFSKNLFSQGAGNALNFDGSNDYVNIDVVANDMAGQQSGFSFLAWIKAANTHTGSKKGTILGLNENDGDIKLCLFVGGNGNNRITAYERSGYELTGSVIGDNTWHHVAYVRNGSTGTLYVDCIIQGTHPASETFTSNDLWSIAQEWDIPWPTVSDALGGQVDEISIWKTPLSETQIRDNMCKKLTGVETNLVAYYRFDESSGISLPDLTSNNNNGTLENGPNWVTSGAPIGDASTSDYSNPFSVTLASSYGDNLTATITSGTASGIHVYRIDESPNVTTPPSGWSVISPSHYFGVLLIGSSIVYTVTYDYSGHPGISNESTLNLAKRDDNSDGTWADAEATLNTGSNTLIKTGETGTEYVLGSTSSDNSLPVSLSSFTGIYRNGKVILEWVTESELGNLGFILERQIKGNNSWQIIASYQTNESLMGQGNSSHRKEYTFMDSNVENGVTYQYRLSNVDIDGYVSICDIFEVTIDTLPLPNETVLLPAFPNPFNSNTKISYKIDKDTNINLHVVSVLGQTIKYILKDANQSAGSYNFYWDGKNHAGEFMPSGVYVIILESDSFLKSQKVLLVK